MYESGETGWIEADTGLWDAIEVSKTNVLSLIETFHWCFGHEYVPD